MIDFVVALLVMVLVVGSLVAWAVRADRRRRDVAPVVEKKGEVA